MVLGDIAKATPHENDFWNCVTCGNQCLGTSFIRFRKRVFFYCHFFKLSFV
jgi:hypothetical protein